MTLTELLESGELEGYLPEAPTAGLISGAEIDRQVAASAACSRCKHRGLEYNPFRSRASPTGPSPSARSAERRTSSDPTTTPSPAGRRQACPERNPPMDPNA